MKKYLLFSVFILMLSCSEKPEIKFEYTQFDFGTIQQNVKVSHIFKFINSGKETLRIKDIKAG